MDKKRIKNTHRDPHQTHDPQAIGNEGSAGETAGGSDVTPHIPKPGEARSFERETRGGEKIGNNPSGDKKRGLKGKAS